MIMREIKISACDKAYELIQIIDQINDEEFVDNIIDCIRYNDYCALSDLREDI